MPGSVVRPGDAVGSKSSTDTAFCSAVCIPGQQFSTRGHLALFGIAWGCHSWVDGSAVDIWWVDIGMLINILNAHDSPHNKNLSSPNTNSAKEEKLFQREIETQNTN